ncbi:MAG: RHS repeat protein [Ruminococcaceae bacterium]|nr:RHS repeat protein [Oscillospiraceae bacterium]
MKKIISMVLVFTMLASIVNVSFAAEVEQGDITSYDASAASDITSIDFALTNNEKMTTFDYADDENISCIPSKPNLLPENLNEPIKATDIEMDEGVEAISDVSSVNTTTSYSTTDFTFNAHLLTSFNTITGPIAGNGANEPKFSYNSFLEESISDYSGELTLNFEDLVLDGRNGLDLRIGRTYQTVASNTGEKSIMILPNENGYLRNDLVNNYSTYLLDRYNLGMGWGFSFPSVQIETEYIPQEVVDTYYYDEESELYYHSGNGEVYQVQFTSDTTDSNLKGYYNKDIQFNRNDKAYSNGQVTSYYSMTLADKTKQYFAEDGRLIGIVDRFGNTIKFEHELSNITNRVPDGNFRYDDDMWTPSTASSGSYDAYPIEDADIGSNDGYAMYFRRENENGESYIASQPIQVKPLTDYNLGIRIKSQYEPDVKVEIIGYDTAYNYCHTRTYWITDYGTDWYDFNQTFSMSSAVRYVIIKISPEYAYKTYIDNITLDEPKPLLKAITDSVGRVITFNYSGDLTTGGAATGAVTLSITSPDGSSTRTLTYNKEVIEFATEYLEHDEQRLFWYLNSSSTEGDDGATVKYTYEGGTTTNADGTLAYPQLFLRYDSKTHSDSDGWVNKPVLNSVRYKDRKKIYEYETVRKHLGDDGYYDTLRIKKKYDMYSYVPEGETKSYFKGELGTVNYSYSGLYNGNSFNNETGYPSYEFDDETTLNEQWTVTKTGKTTDTISFSNCAVVQQTSSSGGVSVTSDYTNHETFKNSPVQIKNTVAQGGQTKETYLIYSYNDWGGVASETKEVDADIKNNSSLLEKYTTNYQYNDFHYITQKEYYNNLDSPQVSEINTFNSNGLLTSSENAVNEKTYYYYENETYPFLVTKTTLDDPMRFHNLMGGDRIVTYTYDTYGLYPLTITESYDNGTANTSYVYDYITGDILKETLPDGSYTQYTYYSDGKVNLVASPLSLSVDSRYLYTIDQHIYNSNAILNGYGDETPTYDVEQIIRYVVYTDEGTPTPYILDINYYDAVGNLKQAQQGYYKADDTSVAYLKSTTQYYHDTYDRLIKTVDNEDNAVIYTYDGFDRPVTITDSENNVYTYTYNSIQNKVDLSLNGATESTDRQLMTQTFDLYGNVVENVVYPSNSSETLSEIYEYDLNNNTISYTNANGNKTEYLYDAANRLKETKLPNGVKATSSYNVFNEPTFEKIYTSDGTEKSARITYQNEKGDRRMRFFNYDRRLVDSAGYSADAKGRTTQISEGENTYNFTYDQLDHPVILTSGQNQIHRRYNQFGEIAAASTDGNTPEIRYGYDYVGNISAKLQNDVHYMAYAYSGLGHIVQSLMPSERLENYTYTANGSLNTVVSDEKTFDYDYYDTGYVKSITYPNGLKTTYNYDNINRVTSMITTMGTTTINTFLYE